MRVTTVAHLRQAILEALTTDRTGTHPRALPADRLFQVGLPPGLPAQMRSVRALPKPGAFVIAARQSTAPGVADELSNEHQYVFGIVISRDYHVGFHSSEADIQETFTRVNDDFMRIRAALCYPGALDRTAAGDPTGIADTGLIATGADSQIRFEEMATPTQGRLLNARDSFTCRVLFDPRGADVPPPAFVRLPSIHVADATEPVVGGSLIADPGEAEHAHTLRGQWLRDGAELEGESGTVYSIVEADEGAELAYRATAIGSGGTVSETTPGIVVGAGVPLPDGFPIPDPGLLLIAGHGHAGAAPGEPVRTWDDYGDLKCRFGAELDERRPTLEAVPEMGGLPAVKFRASDQTTLTCVSREALRDAYCPDTGATFFAAFFNESYPSGTAQEVILDAANIAHTNPNFSVAVSALGGGALTLRIGSQGAAAVNENLLPGVSSGRPHFAVIRLQMGASPNWEVRLDGAVLGSGDFAAPPTDAPTPQPTRVGGRIPTESNYFDGHLGTLGHIPRRLEGEELAELETWLARYRP